jgi:hypothetical protein
VERQLVLVRPLVLMQHSCDEGENEMRNGNNCAYYILLQETCYILHLSLCRSTATSVIIRVKVYRKKKKTYSYFLLPVI